MKKFSGNAYHFLEKKTGEKMREIERKSRDSIVRKREEDSR